VLRNPQTYQVVQPWLEVVEHWTARPLIQKLDALLTVMSAHLSSHHIGHTGQDQASIELAQVVAMEVVAVGVGDNAPYPLMSRSEVLVVVQQTCEMGNTSLAVRGSCCSDMDLRCMSTQNQVVRDCKFEVMTLADLDVAAESEKESWDRWKRRQSCMRNWNCRSKCQMTQEIQVNQPGVTMYRRRSMPVAAVAKIERVACRSHMRRVVERRDDCSMVRQRVPGSALLISTEAPVFRLNGIKSELDNKRAGSTIIS
jgi:hypothetical protein